MRKLLSDLGLKNGQLLGLQLTIFLFTLICTSGNAQILQGRVIGEAKTWLPYINVIARDTSATIVAYTQTDDIGRYSLTLSKTGTFFIAFSGLGFKEEIDTVIFRGGRIYLDMKLYAQEQVLNEVIIRASPPIVVKKDTIVFDAKAFRQGNESVVEDLLKKIPGLTVEKDGTVKVRGQEVEKIMIEGDDFFEKGYILITKNMPVSPINKVEVIQRYSENKLLKGIEHSDKVALNLTINKAEKVKWFGNTELTADAKRLKYYEGRVNLINVSKKTKYYFLANLNNLGNPVAEEIAGLTDNNDESTPPQGFFFSFPKLSTQFKITRTNINNDRLASANAIFNPTEKTKIKTLITTARKGMTFGRTSREDVQTGLISFVNNESLRLTETATTNIFKVDAVQEYGNDKSLKVELKGSNELFTNSLVQRFNDLPVNEFSRDTQKDIYANSVFTKRLNPQSVFILTGRLHLQNAIETYQSDYSYFQDIFSTQSLPMIQRVNNQRTRGEITAKWIQRKKNTSTEISAGIVNSSDKLKTAFRPTATDTIQSIFKNNFQYATIDIFSGYKYRISMKNLEFFGMADVHQLINQLTSVENQSPLLLNPGLGMNWTISKKNKLTFQYQRKIANALLTDIAGNFILTESRTLTRGLGGFAQTANSNVILNYQFGNWGERFLLNAFAFYTYNHQFLGNETVLSKNSSLAEKKLFRGGDMLNVNIRADQLFYALKLNLKLEYGLNKTQQQNIINNSAIRPINITNNKYLVEVRSVFNGWFNYHFGMDINVSRVMTTGISNRLTNTFGFIDLLFTPINRFTLNLQGERYTFGQNGVPYYFIDFQARYELIPSKLTISCLGKNLLNNTKFESINMNDFSTRRTEDTLLPRMILTKFEHRF